MTTFSEELGQRSGRADRDRGRGHLPSVSCRRWPRGPDGRQGQAPGLCGSTCSHAAIAWGRCHREGPVRSWAQGGGTSAQRGQSGDNLLSTPVQGRAAGVRAYEGACDTQERREAACVGKAVCALAGASGTSGVLSEP